MKFDNIYCKYNFIQLFDDKARTEYNTDVPNGLSAFKSLEISRVDDTWLKITDGTKTFTE